MNPPPDDDGYRPRPLLGPGFWVALAFCALLVLAGVAVDVLGPRLG